MREQNAAVHINSRSKQVLDTQDITRESIRPQLEAYTTKHKIKSLQDRLRIGLNEVGILGVEGTRAIFTEVCNVIAGGEQEGKLLLKDVEEMVLNIQQSGPWEYAQELSTLETPRAQAWYILAGAEVIGYEREMDLSDDEFEADVQRIAEHLSNALNNPSENAANAHVHLLEKAKKLIRFDENDTEKTVPIGEGLHTALSMAIMGYESGVAQDAEGWVYVMSKEKITDSMIESTGLTKEIAPDERDPKRMVTFYKNKGGQRVLKKIHDGFLVVLSRSFELGTSIVRAINEDKDVITIAEESLGHTRVIQTTEKKTNARTDEILDEWEKKAFLRIPDFRANSDKPAEGTAISDPRESFYNQMLYIRGMYVYLDALRLLEQERAKQDKEVKVSDKDRLSERIWDKMEQKVDELRHVNELLDRELGTIPDSVHSVVDMAGGAGDLGLAVTNELLSRGRDIHRTEIVDPQEGTDDFMETIIDHLPFREKLKQIAEHNNGYLQDAHISPDSMVVAKHACGTLTDDVIEMWRSSDSPVMCVMTCCQDKAKDHPARYGLSQEEWHRYCSESVWTNTIIPEEKGQKREQALKKLERGKEAMLKLDQARVEYLRRHGFKAELHTTDKFPKGDVIIARRLPKNFMATLKELRELEIEDPVRFDSRMLELDKLGRGGKSKSAWTKNFDEEWVQDDFSELIMRLDKKNGSSRSQAESPNDTTALVLPEENASERQKKDEALQARAKKEQKQEEEALFRVIFSDIKGGKIDGYIRVRCGQKQKSLPTGKAFGELTQKIQTEIRNLKGNNPQMIRDAIDTMMDSIGY